MRGGSPQGLRSSDWVRGDNPQGLRSSDQVRSDSPLTDFTGCLEVFVTYVVSPSKLYVQLVGSETQSEWRRMEEDLQYAPLERW